MHLDISKKIVIALISLFFKSNPHLTYSSAESPKEAYIRIRNRMYHHRQPNRKQTRGF